MRRTYYVYVVFRPWDGSPCYVGKGHGDRWKKFSPGDRSNLHLLNIAAKAKRLGMELPVVKARNGLTETEAFEIERAFIAAIGRGKEGSLVNLSDGGDGPSGARHSKKARARIGAKSKEMWSNEEKKKIILASQRASRATPEFHKKRSAISSIIANDPAWRERHSKVMSDHFSDLENRINTSTATQIAMERPDVKANTCAAQKERWADPNEREKQSERLMGRTLSAQHRAAIGAGHFGQKRSQEARANMSAAQFRRSPPSAETRAKMSASAKARRPQPMQEN